MSLFRSLVKNLRQQMAGQRTVTPAEVRELIEQRAFLQARDALDWLPVDLVDKDAVRSCLLGEVLFQQGDDAAALGAFRDALRKTPGLTPAHLGLSLVLAERGALDDALRHAFFAHSMDSVEPRYLAQLGYCHLRLKNFALAEAPLRRATLRAPNDLHAWNNLGVVLMAKGDKLEALRCFRKAISIRPGFGAAEANLEQLEGELRTAGDNSAEATALDVLTNIEQRGDVRLFEVLVFEQQGKLKDAIDACEALVLDAPNDALLALHLQGLYIKAGDPASGIDALEAFRTRNPDDSGVAGALGLAHLELRSFRLAESLLRPVLEARPDSHEWTLGLAQALIGQERYAEAGALLDRAQHLVPDDQKTRILHAANMINQCCYEEGLAECRQLEAEGLVIPSLGIVLSFLGRFDEALEALDRSIAVHPNDPQVRFFRGGVNLLLQNFEKGWEDYSFRGLNSVQDFRALPFEFWKGEPLEGKSILVLAEQGLGDQVMFASCLQDLLSLKPSGVVVEMSHRVAPTIARSFPGCRILATKQERQLDWLKDCPTMDYYVPLADLPRYFRRSLDSFPPHNGYLVADARRVDYWRSRLLATGPGPYIGFSWKGGVESTRTTLRSIDAMAFAPLAAARPGTWVCLQYGAVNSQVEDARSRGFPVSYWPEGISDLDEFAALIAALDLVVTVCNTTVHYAGALARPVWVLAPKVPEWRYGANNRTLPWYPSSLIYRQHEAGDWKGVLDEVRRELTLWGPSETNSA